MNPDEGRLRIDAHVHLMAADQPKHKCLISPKRRRSLTAWYLARAAGVGMRVSDEVFDIAYADHLANLVRGARFLDKALVFGMDGLYDSSGMLDPRTEALVSNDWAMEVTRRHPDVFIFGASIHPARPDALEELDRCAEAGAVCVKWVPPSMGMDPGDKRYTPFYARMKELDLVLTSHTGYEHSVFVVDQSLGDPDRLRLPLEMGLTVVAGHAGTSGFYHQVEYFGNMVRVCQEYQNLYADTSAIANPVRFTYREMLLQPPLVDRLIQGTDYPVPPTPILWLAAIGPLEAARIQATRNPFDRDYLGKVASGFPLEQFYRGADVFRVSA
ncbi:MAG TPA: amidohydrolase family protein [Candidatus Anoxymicrobiaceae bacterium]